MDNAANNDTFVSKLQMSLVLRDDFTEDVNNSFSGSTQRIQYVIYFILY